MIEIRILSKLDSIDVRLITMEGRQVEDRGRLIKVERMIQSLLDHAGIGS